MNTGPGPDEQFSVDGKDVALDLVAELGLQVTQLLLQHRQGRHDDGLRPQRAAWLHVVVEPSKGKDQLGSVEPLYDWEFIGF